MLALQKNGEENSLLLTDSYIIRADFISARLKLQNCNEKCHLTVS